MGNIEGVSLAVSSWAFNIAKSILPKVNIPNESAIGKFMYGILGINPASYNLWSELGFLAQPTIQAFISPMLNNVLKGMTDEQIKDIAMQYADAMIAEVERKGSINLFGLELHRDAIEDLKRLLTEKLGE
jgi:hypothetical protein